MIDRIKISREFKDNILGGLWLGVEATIDEREDVGEAFIKANEELNLAYSRINPSLLKVGELPTIDRSVERRKILMDDCTSIEELAKWKPKEDDSEELRKYYMDKLKQLTKKIVPLKS